MVYVDEGSIFERLMFIRIVLRCFEPLNKDFAKSRVFDFNELGAQVNKLVEVLYDFIQAKIRLATGDFEVGR
uniref:Uncharacterized protein n=1 Tax=Acrobeloides nanus TaxID=290746 RepID=A0A914CS87_9BILA